MISGTTRLLGVIGDPVAHSRSPRMQNAALHALGLNWAYVPLPVKAANVESVLRGLQAVGFVGVNVTVPHKEAVAQLVDELRPTAQASGSVNTVIFAEDGRLIGDSTDGPAIAAAIASEIEETYRGSVLVLGAGGSDTLVWDAADVLVDGHGDDRLAEFSDLARVLFHSEPDREAELARISAFFLDRQHLPVADEERIHAIHSALIDPEVDCVSALVDRAGISQRTVERVCQRAFGFPPKLLLRRQRFLRSLAKYVLDPSLKWIGALDSQYHDQAQFVRDFKQFMGMSPRQYGLLDKPILTAVMRERARFSGKAVQGLDTPEGGGG